MPTRSLNGFFLSHTCSSKHEKNLPRELLSNFLCTKEFWKQNNKFGRTYFLLFFFKYFLHAQRLRFVAVPIFLLLSNFFSAWEHALFLSAHVVLSKVADALSLSMTRFRSENLLSCFFLIHLLWQLHNLSFSDLHFIIYFHIKH